MHLQYSPNIGVHKTQFNPNLGPKNALTILM